MSNKIVNVFEAGCLRCRLGRAARIWGVRSGAEPRSFLRPQLALLQPVAPAEEPLDQHLLREVVDRAEILRPTDLMPALDTQDQLPLELLHFREERIRTAAIDGQRHPLELGLRRGRGELRRVEPLDDRRRPLSDECRGAHLELRPRVGSERRRPPGTGREDQGAHDLGLGGEASGEMGVRHSVVSDAHVVALRLLLRRERGGLVGELPRALGCLAPEAEGRPEHRTVFLETAARAVESGAEQRSGGRVEQEDGHVASGIACSETGLFGVLVRKLGVVSEAAAPGRVSRSTGADFDTLPRAEI